jgi:uncharacterized protein (TIGR00369 family)
MKVEALTERGVTLRMPFSTNLCRSEGEICEAAVASAADTAMLIAISSAMRQYTPVEAIDISVNHACRITCSDALFDAEVIRLGRSIACCTATVRDVESGKTAAVASGTFALSPS